MADCQDKIVKTCGKRTYANCLIYEGALHANTKLDKCNTLTQHQVNEDYNAEFWR